MKKIKPCPFCGGYAKLRKFGQAYAVKCGQCGAQGRWEYREKHHTTPCITQNLAIDDWNMRYREDGNV